LVPRVKVEDIAVKWRFADKRVGFQLDDLTKSGPLTYMENGELQEVPEEEPRDEFTGNDGKPAQRLNYETITGHAKEANPEAFAAIKFATKTGRKRLFVREEDADIVKRKVSELCEKADNCIFINQEHEINKRGAKQDEGDANIKGKDIGRALKVAQNEAEEELARVKLAEDKLKTLTDEEKVNVDKKGWAVDRQTYEEAAQNVDTATRATAIKSADSITWKFDLPHPNHLVEAHNEFTISLQKGEMMCKLNDLDAVPIPAVEARWEFQGEGENARINYATLSDAGKKILGLTDKDGPIGVIKYQTEEGRANSFQFGGDIDVVKAKVKELCGRATFPKCVFTDEDAQGTDTSMATHYD
jgi:hypothetical protein